MRARLHASDTGRSRATAIVVVAAGEARRDARARWARVHSAPDGVHGTIGDAWGAVDGTAAGPHGGTVVASPLHGPSQPARIYCTLAGIRALALAYLASRCCAAWLLAFEPALEPPCPPSPASIARVCRRRNPTIPVRPSCPAPGPATPARISPGALTITCSSDRSSSSAICADPHH